MNKKYNYFLFQLHSYKKLNGTNKARVLYMKKIYLEQVEEIYLLF